MTIIREEIVLYYLTIGLAKHNSCNKQEYNCHAAQKKKMFKDVLSNLVQMLVLKKNRSQEAHVFTFY
jgi:hypothetical protein